MARRDIEFLPPGWRWVPSGEKRWTTTAGKTSFERHGEGPNGETISTYEVQKRQRAERARLGQPKPEAVRRTGKSRTIKGTKASIGRQGQHFGAFDPELHGETQVISFYDWSSMRSHMALSYDLDLPFEFGFIAIHYCKYLGGRKNSPGTSGYAMLAGPINVADLVDSAATTGEILMSGAGNPWNEALFNLKYYDMECPEARFYIILVEE